MKESVIMNMKRILLTAAMIAASVSGAFAFSVSQEQANAIFAKDKVIFLSIINDKCKFVKRGDMQILRQLVEQDAQDYGVNQQIWNDYHVSTDFGSKSMYYNMQTEKAFMNAKTTKAVKALCKDYGPGFMKLYNELNASYDESGEEDDG